jgi:hypothetical protein
MKGEKTFGNVAATPPFSAHLEEWKKNENSKSYYTMAVHVHYVVIALLLCSKICCLYEQNSTHASQSIYGFARWNSVP